MILRRVGRALLRHCPRCGSGGIFHLWTRMADRCPRCDLRFEREDGYWLGAILINTVAVMGVFALGMIVWATATWPDPPWGLMTVVGIGFNLIAPIAFYPYSKTLWVAIEITAHPPAEWDPSGRTHVGS